MTKAQRRELQRYLDRATNKLQLRRVLVSPKTVIEAWGEDIVAAVSKNARTGAMVFFSSERFFDLPDAQKVETVGHELMHAWEHPKWALVDRWRGAGQISGRQYALYTKREEATVLWFERAIAQLLPPWSTDTGRSPRRRAAQSGRRSGR